MSRFAGGLRDRLLDLDDWISSGYAYHLREGGALIDRVPTSAGISLRKANQFVVNDAADPELNWAARQMSKDDRLTGLAARYAPVVLPTSALGVGLALNALENALMQDPEVVKQQPQKVLL
jgi:hypothetical protein